jgi:hypothetical protein
MRQLLGFLILVALAAAGIMKWSRHLKAQRDRQG